MQSLLHIPTLAASVVIQSEVLFKVLLLLLLLRLLLKEPWLVQRGIWLFLDHLLSLGVRHVRIWFFNGREVAIAVSVIDIWLIVAIRVVLATCRLRPMYPGLISKGHPWLELIQIWVLQHLTLHTVLLVIGFCRLASISWYPRNIYVAICFIVIA